MKKTKPTPPIPARSAGRPKLPRGGFSPAAIRMALASRGFTGSWLVARLEAEGARVDRRRVYGWLRGADIPPPGTKTLKAMASILGVKQSSLRGDE